MKISLFSSSLRLAKKILDNHDICEIIVEKRILNKKLVKFTKDYSIPLKTLDRKENLDDIKYNGNIGIIFGFGFILTKKIISKFSKGIINIHPGDLKKFRGRHPIGWALIKGEKEIVITAHKITDKIDLGKVIHKSKFKINNNDDDFSLNKKAERIISGQFILDVINNYQNCIEIINKGKYFPSLKGHLDKLNPEKYDSGFMLGLMRAKKPFGGIKVGNKTFVKCEMYDPKLHQNLYSYNSFLCIDGKRIILS